MQGIGVSTGARILIETGDGSTFPTAGHLTARVGLAPATRSSGSATALSPAIWSSPLVAPGLPGTQARRLTARSEPPRDGPAPSRRLPAQAPTLW